MSNLNTFNAIKQAMDDAPRNGYVAELHLQVIKHSSALNNVSGKEFCEALGLKSSWGTEFAKMKKIAPRLTQAGLNVNLI